MPPRLILFGAFDRHNFGDQLLGHCAFHAAREDHPGREVVFAGLIGRDLRWCGGHRVRALPEVIETHGGEPAELVHVGGEILTTSAWEAAVMLQRPADAPRVIARFDRDPDARRGWACEVLGCAREAPYVVGRRDVPGNWRIRFAGVGGVELDRIPEAMRREVCHALRGAGEVTVRDQCTRAALAASGIEADLVPDPAAATARNFAGRIERRAARGPLAGLARRFPRGWLAVQLAAAWGDDATLDRFAREAHRMAADAGCGIVLFRAGIAPWHDDAAVLARLATRLTDIPTATLDSIHVFDICAALARARGYLGSSLHGWIVAESFGVPGICLVSGPEAKAAVYLGTWAPDTRPWRTVAEFGE